ncbi:MAG: contractile injection system protein, VgrG/Pvc8 family, partial [Georgfuchsia sp.]
MVDAEVNPRPAWRIDVDGVNITPSISDRLISLTLTDNRGMEADQLDLCLDDADGRLSLPPRGAALHLWLGWEAEGLTDKGTYTVDEVEHCGAPDQLTIRARSADLRAGLSTQRTRSFHNVALADIVNNIAASHGLVATIAAQVAAETISHLDQTNESDANLLTRLAGMFDAIATVKNDKLLFLPAGAGRSASGKPLPVMSITREDGDSHRFSIAERDSMTAVKAVYHDLDLGQQGEVIWSKAEDEAERNKQPAAIVATTAGEYKPFGTKPYPTRAKALRAATKEWKRIKRVKALAAKYAGVKVKYHDAALGVDGEVSYGRADDEAKRRHAKK